MLQLSESQQKVYDILLCNPSGLCDRQISEKTGLPVYTINGVRNILIKKGLVSANGEMAYPDYHNRMRTVTCWGVHNVSVQY